VLGCDNQKEILAQHDLQRALDIETPNAAPRFQQAPGGNATVQLGNEKGCSGTVSATPTKGPVGGATTIVLGVDDGEVAGTAPAPVRGPVGGATAIVLGCDDPSEAFPCQPTAVETPDAPSRFTQAPGGTATVVLGGAVVHEPHNPLRQAPGGSATIVLGGDPTDPLDTFSATTSSNKFASGANQNCGNTITDRPTTRLLQAPGGSSSICLGDENVSSTPVKKSQSCLSTPVRTVPTPSRLRQSPGGEATICFGGDAADPFNTHTVSSSKFANGANQNCGNVITDRSSTRLHHAPGGASTLCLG
jgi:hypothetical protein